MKRDRICYVLIILTALFAVLIAGCLTSTPEKSSTPLPTATPQYTPAPLETPPENDSTTITPGSFVNVSFESGGISIQYPNRFREISNTSLGKMRAIADPTGINILTILTANDSKDSIQVTRQTAEATIEGLYNEKEVIANEVAVNGTATVVAMTFVKYVVKKTKLPNGTDMIKVIAEDSKNGTAVTYLLCKNGYVYNINFVYDNMERAESQASARDSIIQTVHLD